MDLAPTRQIHGSLIHVSARPKGGHLELMWDDEGDQMWLHKPADGTWLECRVLHNIGAPPSHRLACGHEVSLIREFEPNVVGTPDFLGESHAFASVVGAVLGVLLLRLELIFTRPAGFTTPNTASWPRASARTSPCTADQCRRGTGGTSG